MRFPRLRQAAPLASHEPDPTPPLAPTIDTRAENRRKFVNLTRFAESVADKNPLAISAVISAILRPEQSELILDVMENGPRGQQGIDGASFFVENVWDCFGKDELVPVSRPSHEYRLLLGRDTILTHPWGDAKLLDHIAFTGRDKAGADPQPDERYNGAWVQDTNHVVGLWLPWRIGFVGNGYHSTAAGILAAEGSIIPTHVEDWTFLLDLMETDGVEYRDRRTRKSLGPVTDVRRAAVFEIGRLSPPIRP